MARKFWDGGEAHNEIAEYLTGGGLDHGILPSLDLAAGCLAILCSSERGGNLRYPTGDVVKVGLV